MVATLGSSRLKMGSMAKQGIKLWIEHPEQLRSCSLKFPSAPQTNAAAHLAAPPYQIQVTSRSLRKPG